MPFGLRPLRVANPYFMFNHPRTTSELVLPTSKRPRCHRFLVAALLGISLLGWQWTARGQEPTVVGPTVELPTKSGGAYGSEPVATAVRTSPKVELYTEFMVGYDDNFRTRSDAAGSWFTNGRATLTYRPGFRDMDFDLVTGASVNEYFQNRTDLNIFLGLTLDRKLTPRLTLDANVYAAYRSEPDFGANIGPNQVRGNYFTTSDRLSGTYQVTRRFATVTSYQLKLIRYEDSFTAAFSDRGEHTFGEQFRFDISRSTVLTGDYRFLVVDYVTAPRNSLTHFVLAGIEHQFNADLHGQLRGGVSLRSFEQDGDSANPDVEWSLDYNYSRDSSLSWTGSYSVEESTNALTAERTTVRTQLQLNQHFTNRISGSLSFAYHHDDNTQPTTSLLTVQNFTEDSFRVAVSLKYQVNRWVDVNAQYEHSEVSSQALQSYSRNRYSIGVGLRF